MQTLVGMNLAKEVVSKQTTVTVLRQVVVEHVVVDRLSYRILHTYYNVGIGERIRIWEN